MTAFMMDLRDVAAAILAVALLILGASVATRLQGYRRQRDRARASQADLGRKIVAELPTGDDLTLFSEDDRCFYYGDQAIDKEAIVAARVLINGAPIAAAEATRYPNDGAPPPTSLADHVEGIARDRWDVAIETRAGATLVECGAIRERVSQELARAVFDAVKRDIERRNSVTARLREHRHGD
jgi:hypothetical protein